MSDHFRIRKDRIKEQYDYIYVKFKRRERQRTDNTLYKKDWLLVVLGFNATLTAKVISDAYAFPGFLTPVLTQLFFPKPPTTFLTYFCRGERRKYVGKKKSPQPGIEHTQAPGHEYDTLTTEPPRRGCTKKRN